MPELPEVETTRLGIKPHVEKQIINKFVVRNGNLRWPVEKHLTQTLQGVVIESVERRGKYILLGTPKGVLMVHLGMSGNLRILPKDTKVVKHDHIDIQLDNQLVLRLNDPRRFGSVLWHDLIEGSINNHRLLSKLGPEPLSADFNSNYLFEKVKNRKVVIKKLIMDSHIVVGAGNIYASESLFTSGIHPLTLGHQLTLKQTELLVSNIRKVLLKSIEQGGTTLKDFLKPDGKPGYFVQQLNVYGRHNEPCHECGTLIEKTVIAQRASFYCPHCQPHKTS